MWKNSVAVFCLDVRVTQRWGTQNIFIQLKIGQNIRDFPPNCSSLQKLYIGKICAQSCVIFSTSHRPTFCKYTVGSSFYTTVHTHTVYECVFIVQCTYMYNLQYCTCSIFICRAEGSALAHPPTAPIPNQHARPGVGYICGLWVLPSRYNSQSKRANADCAQFVFPLYSFLFCHL